MHSQKQNNQTLIGLLLLLLLGTIWGTGYSIARFAMTNGVPPFGYSFWQSLGPAIIVGCAAFYRQKTVQISSSKLRFYLICGLSGVVIPNTSMYFAASHLPASILAMVVNIVPIVAYPLALFVRLETFNWQRMLGVSIAFCGLLLIILPHSSLPSPAMVPWVLFTLIAPISFAYCSIYIARYQPAGTDSLSLSAGMLIASSLLLTPMVIATDSFYTFHFPFLLPDWIIMLEIILSSLGYILFFKLIKLAGPVYYSLVDTIVVVTGLFWGYIIFGEHLNKWTGTAIFLILFALLLVTQQQKKIAAPITTVS